MSPKWESKNLTKHHQKRLRENTGCFEDLMGLAKPMAETQYESRSYDAVANSWGEYEARAKEEWSGEFRETRAYFVDDDLVVAITDAFRHDFVTCFHEHPGRRHVSRSAMPSLGQRRLEFRQRLENDVRGKRLIDLKRIRGVG